MLKCQFVHDEALRCVQSTIVQRYEVPLAALAPVPGLALYSASKFAVRGYSLVAGMELAEHGIAVTTICPDAVQTPMLDQQKDKEQAALTFSGARALIVQEVVDAILDNALKNKPLEIILPTMRGVIAKAANAFPTIAARQVGMQRQQKINHVRIQRLNVSEVIEHLFC